MLCISWDKRFTYESILETHFATHRQIRVSSSENLKDMTVVELKDRRSRGARDYCGDIQGENVRIEYLSSIQLRESG